MPDITTTWAPETSSADWSLDGPDLASGLDIQTAVLISLFTDRQADPDDAAADGLQDPRGWWGDLDADTRIGSRLWQLDRAKATDLTRTAARAMVLEALEWLVDDGVVARVDAEAAWIGTGALGVTVTVFKPDGASLVMRFATAWNGTL